MEDEYDQMTCDGNTYVHPEPFVLESGQVLEQAQLRYQTYGELNESRDNVLVVCHALTGNASLHAWWGEMLGSGKAFDTDRYFVVCCNILGSCYGSTNPKSINPKTGEAYGLDFPDISVKDTVRLQLHMLVDELKLNSVLCVIGGSFGGMQTLEFAVQAGSFVSDFKAQNSSDKTKPEPFVKSAVIIACGASHTAWQIALSEVQRQAIYADPNWPDNAWEATQGLSIARQVGMVTYRTPTGYCKHFGRRMQETKKEGDNDRDGSESSNSEDSPRYGSKAYWSVKSYLEYQGRKFLPRFDPITYVKLTEQMDSHDVGRGRGDDIPGVLASIKIPVLIMGIDSDVLYPLGEQEELAKYIPKGKLCIVRSEAGHDGFLLEQDQMSRHITDFLRYQERLKQLRKDALERKQKAVSSSSSSQQQQQQQQQQTPAGKDSSSQLCSRRSSHISFRGGLIFAAAGPVGSV